MLSRIIATGVAPETQSPAMRRRVRLVNVFALLLAAFFVVSLFANFALFDSPWLSLPQAVALIVGGAAFRLNQTGRQKQAQYFLSAGLPFVMLLTAASVWLIPGIEDRLLHFLMPKYVLALGAFLPALLLSYENSWRWKASFLPFLLAFLAADLLFLEFTGKDLRQIYFQQELYRISFAYLPPLFVALGSLVYLLRLNEQYETRVTRLLDSEAENNRQLLLMNNEISQQSEEIRLQSEVIKEQNDSLNDALKELEALGRLKDSLSGMLAHDLKNPLTAIIGMADRPDLANRRDQLRAAARRMETLTLNMLDVQKFESAEVKMNLAPVSVARVSAAALEQVAFLAAEKCVELRAEASTEAAVLADEEYLVRILVNLLNNAVKFARLNGNVRLKTAVIENRAAFFVTDDGPGIPPDKLAAIFEKFAQLDDEAGVNRKGTGLGLAFCKMAAAALGGSIRAESTPGAGAAFVLELPLAIAPPDFAAGEALAVMEPFSSREADWFSQADRATLAPVAAKMREMDIFEVSELTQALADLDRADSPAVIAWRRRAENAVFSMNESALRKALDEAPEPENLKG